MNPMSLLTLSTDTLRKAAECREPLSPCAERIERCTAAVITGLVLAAALATVLLSV